MTSSKQIEANRRNSLNSTGPKTEAGKQASRCNAVRHGLTAETVIGALEDAEDYKTFEASIAADYTIGCGAGARAAIGQSPVAATTGDDHRDSTFRNPGRASQRLQKGAPNLTGLA